ncbi:DUF6221 family protein [Streptomyces antimycoticus]|uniref:DUF6221 family protein n=1 Tax=Streptomyces antimycoticus TaxID=68175 RepID=UPI00386E1523|nr:DUF6221 family protein [Streptomyces antimycoticus]
MTDIADFLRARYAERRELAEAASPGPWHVNAEHDEVLAVDGFALSGRQLRATTEHIAANDPEDVIADLDAKLAIVAAYESAAVGQRASGGAGPAHDLLTGAANTMHYALRLLAQPFAGHPDHKGEEWAV